MEYRVRLEAGLGEAPAYLWVTEKLEVVVFQDGGQVRAFSSLCPHMGAALKVERGGRSLFCPWHGLCFDTATRRSGHPRYPNVREFAARLDGRELVMSER